ncbi:MAG: di-heme oxidoredictase family protein [Paracoccaceae bacterium]
MTLPFHTFALVTAMCIVPFAGVHAEPKTSAPYFSEPLPDLAPNQLRDFYVGMERFSHFYGPDDGLGPLFNEHSCATCHAIPLAGGAGLSRSTFVQQKSGHKNAAGGPNFAKFLLANGTQTTSRFDPSLELRRPPSLHGLGLLEAIPTKDILAGADPLDVNGDGISGRVGGTDGSFGRFGWKASVSSISVFNAQALINEHGVTSDLYPEDGTDNETIEISTENRRVLDAFVTFLAAPPALPRTNHDVIDGEQVFSEIGCAACHTPSHKLAEFEVPHLNGVQIYPYTDLLLHDMGVDLADGIAEGEATAQEFRTPPLWGLKYLGPPYLHDGRAADVDSAIRLHGGEADQSVQRYLQLEQPELDLLIRFLHSI